MDTQWLYSSAPKAPTASHPAPAPGVSEAAAFLGVDPQRNLNRNKSSISSSSSSLVPPPFPIVATDRKEDIKDLVDVLGIQPKRSRKKLNSQPSVKGMKKKEGGTGSGVTEAHKNQRGVVVGISSAPIAPPSRPQGALLPTQPRAFTFVPGPSAAAGPHAPSYMRSRVVSDPGSLYAMRPAVPGPLFPHLPSPPGPTHLPPPTLLSPPHHPSPPGYLASPAAFNPRAPPPQGRVEEINLRADQDRSSAPTSRSFAQEAQRLTRIFSSKGRQYSAMERFANRPGNGL